MNKTVLFTLLLLVTRFASGQQPQLTLISQGPVIDTVYVKTAITRAEQLGDQMRYTEALETLEDAIASSKTIRYARGLALAKMHKGIVYYKKGEYHTAITFIKLALADQRTLDVQEQIALCHHWLGNCYYSLGENDMALQYFFQAYAIRENLDDKRAFAFTLANIANIYSDQKDYDRALDYHLRSLKIKLDLQDDRAVAFSYNNIGNVYLGMGLYEEALMYAKKAHSIFDRIDHPSGTAYALGTIGTILEQQMLYGRALESLKKAAKEFEKLGDEKALTEAYNRIGHIQMNMQQFERAAVSLRKAQDLAIKTDLGSELAQNFLHFAELDSLRGNPAQAFSWMKRYTNLREKLFTQEKSRQIAQLQNSIEMERKDRKIQMLEREKQFEMRQRSTQLLILAAGLLIFFMVTLGLIFFLRQKHRTNQILKLQKKQSDELNQLKDKLFSIVAHDLKGPLHSLKSVLSLASADHLSMTELKELLRTIDKNTENTIGLVDNLLMWARESIKGEAMEPRTIRLEDIIQKNIQLVLPQAKLKQIKLTFRQQVEGGVFADRNTIDLVVRNLLSNAIKFTKPGGSIRVQIFPSPMGKTVTVKDDGIGIPAEKLKLIFTPTSVSTRGTANEKGTGLGLLLCKEFVEKNGGIIWAESTEGRGATFCFTLPSTKQQELIQLRTEEMARISAA